MNQGLTNRLVAFSGRHPWVVLFLALGCSAVSWFFASRLQLRTDLLELLPRDSPGFRAFEHQLGKLGGGATLLVIVKSPDRHGNRRFIDDLAAHIKRGLDEDDRCRQTCSGKGCRQCRPKLIARLESGTREIQDYFERNRWLYAKTDELRNADSRIDATVAKQSGMVEDLEDEPDEPSHAAPAQDNDKKELEQAVDRIEERFAKVESQINPAKSGYFETDDGTCVGLRIVANSTPLGDLSGDELLSNIKQLVAVTGPASYHPNAIVGYAGDIPNSLAERESLASDALWATLAALALILAGIAFYFRSLSSLLIVGLPAFIGVGGAYAFAAATYGYVNSTGAFLGAIILGNGINYPIVLLSRYEEFIAQGQEPAAARLTAVKNAFRAELVGAAVASIAYGSLTVTRFRGFSQFGMIGCVGMVLVWCVTIALVPAMLAIVENFRQRRGSTKRLVPHTRAGGTIGRFVAKLGERQRSMLLVLASLCLVVSVSALPKFVADPWEYNFDRLGSRASKSGGAGTWSVISEHVFGGKTNVGGAMMLAESPEQALAIKQQILAKDVADPRGRLIEDVAVIHDFLPGSVAEQVEKIALVQSIQRRLTPRVMRELSEQLRERITRLLPTAALAPVNAESLPSLLRTQFEDRAGHLGTVFYTKYRNNVVLSDGKNLLRMAAITDNVDLPDGTRVQTASRATIFAEMIRSMRRDGPLAGVVAFVAVVIVVLIATHNVVGAIAVIFCLIWGACVMLGGSALLGERLNFVNFIAIPITLGIGCEYPFNVYDRSRLLGGDISGAVERAGMAVVLCSYTTVIGYASLLFADSQALQSFGRMAVRGEIACSLAALLVLPAFLYLLSRLRH